MARAGCRALSTPSHRPTLRKAQNPALAKTAKAPRMIGKRRPRCLTVMLALPTTLALLRPAMPPPNSYPTRLNPSSFYNANVSQSCASPESHPLWYRAGAHQECWAGFRTMTSEVSNEEAFLARRGIANVFDKCGRRPFCDCPARKESTSKEAPMRHELQAASIRFSGRGARNRARRPPRKMSHGVTTSLHFWPCGL